MNLEQREKLFKDPPAKFRGKPFWALNGRLEKEELFRQIDVMKQMGFGGYFMHSRTGLATEYLGDEWFELINSCAQYGSDRDMETWLYDEDRWPSGGAGGLVTENNKYRAMYLTMKIIDSESYNKVSWRIIEERNVGEEQEPGVLAIFAGVLDENQIFTNKRRITEKDNLRNDEVALVFSVDYAPGSGSFNGNSYVNTLCKEAVEYFIQITHEAYKNKCGEKLGKEIIGIFTDEPHNGGMFTDFEEGGKNGCPYTPGMMKEFQRRFNYSLIDNLPDLFLRKKKGEISKVTRDFFELCQTLFLECFAKPIDEWCRKNGLIFTGHVLHEDSLCAQSAMQGSLMRFYEYMEYPGIDILGEYNQCYWAVKQVSSVARQLGKKQVLSELYGGTGWQTSFESYKNIGDWQALLGVNLRCPHLSWYTMKGEAKRDYPASILHQSAWYKEFSYLEEYFSRIHAALWEADPKCRLLVLNPIESVWARAYSGAFDILSAADEDMKRLEKQYSEVFHGLMSHQIDFDYGEEDIMSRYGNVEDGVLRIGKGVYDKVLVAGVDTMRLSTLQLLEQFAANGGQVIFMGDIPKYIDAEPSEKVQAFACESKCIVIPWDEKQLERYCNNADDIQVLSKDKDGELFSQSFQIGDDRLIMILNMNRKERCKIKLNFGKGIYLEYWNPRTGMVVRPDYEVVDGNIHVELELEAGGERLYVVTDRDRNLPMEEVFEKKKVITLPDCFNYKLSEPNICVLDRLSVQMSSGEHIPENEVLKADRNLRDYLKLPYRSGNMLQPWFEEKHMKNYQESVCKVELTYHIQVEEIPKMVELVVENYAYIKNIKINQKDISIKSTGKWIDICFDKIEIPDEVWHKGDNIILISMEYCKDCGLEAIYLLGDFAVRLENSKKVLDILPEKLQFGDITKQGLPFYSGELIYEMEDIDELYGQKAFVEIEEFKGATVKLLGEQNAMLCFQPYRGTVQALSGVAITLTRRNTFGPLHLYPKEAGAYGPESFMTEADHWVDEYQLYEQGLMKMKVYV